VPEILSAGAVKVGKVAESLEVILREWLLLYFDGANHTLWGRTEKFPAAKVAFGEGDLEQPLAGLGITVVVGGGGEGPAFLSTYGVEGSGGLGRDVEERVTIWMVTRAKNGPAEEAAGLGNSRWLCRRADDLLRGLLLDPEATLALGQKGLLDVEVGKSAAEDSREGAVRVMRVRARIAYEY